MSVLVNAVGWLHRRLVKPRQSDRLAGILTELLPEEGRVLDVGCGTGRIARLVVQRNSRLEIQGIDILVQPRAEIAVQQFDGEVIPFADRTFDAVLLVDVLHHTSNQAQLLTETLRVCRRAVIVKDHFCNGLFSFIVLAFMDWVGNRALGVRSPCNYLSKEQWAQLFADAGATEVKTLKVTGLYPFPFSLLFERGKQVIFQLSYRPIH
jgi:SAM-dependent methyltransferase